MIKIPTYSGGIFDLGLIFRTVPNRGDETPAGELYNGEAETSEPFMLSAHAIQDISELRPEYGQLSVDVIAEPVSSVGLSCGLSDLRRRLLSAAVLVILDRQRGALGVVTLADEFPIPDSGEKARLDLLYQQYPERFQAPCLRKNATLQEAAILFGRTETSLLPIVDKNGRYTGRCASLAMLERLKKGRLRPPRIGGLATPLGVYMTSGYYSSGAGWKGLIATGFLFGLLAHFLELWALALFSVLVMIYPPILLLPTGEQTILEGGLLLASLLALIRLTPIAGLHAAEHMTINAMEHGLPLTEPMIRTQPREHQRCGTNLVVLLTGVQVMALSFYFAWGRINILGLALYAALWLWVMLAFWKPAGLWLQQHFTTKDPSSAELASGIKAGQELLDRFNARPHGMPSFWRRIVGAGFLHMVVAFAIAFWLAGQLSGLTGWF